MIVPPIDLPSDDMVKGWRLDLVRNQGLWKGSQYLEAKAEYFALLVKAVTREQLVDVTIYTDTTTYERYYICWLTEQGIDQSVVKPHVRFCLLECSDKRRDEFADLEERYVDILSPLEKQARLAQWLEAANEAVSKAVEGDKRSLGQELCPDYLESHQQSQSDCIVAIY